MLPCTLHPGFTERIGVAASFPRWDSSHNMIHPACDDPDDLVKQAGRGTLPTMTVTVDVREFPIHLVSPFPLLKNDERGPHEKSLP